MRFAILRLSIPVLIALAVFSACAPTSIKHQFDRGQMSKEQWQQEVKNCRYEAEKSVASAPPKVAEYRKDHLYILCLENKGAVYEGEKRVRIQ